MVADDETTVNGNYRVRIPEAVHDELDLGPGDRLRWSVDDQDRLVAEIVRERYGVAETLEPVDIGKTDAVDVMDSGWNSR